MKKRRLMIGTLVAVIIVVLIYKQIDFKKLHNFKIEMNYWILVIAFLTFCLGGLIRAKRFNLLLNDSLRLIDIFRITALYTLYSKLFPGGIGELSFIYLIKKKVQKPLPVGLSSIIITRTYDMLMLAVFSLISVTAISNIKIEKNRYTLYVTIFIVVILILIRNIDKIIEKFGFILGLFFKHKIPWLNKVESKMKLTADVLKDSKNKSLKVSLYTFLFWVTNFLSAQLVFRSLGLQLTYFESILITTISVFISMIPINTFGSFGYKEAGIAFGLILLGVMKNQAIIYSFLFHLMAIAFMLLMAFLVIAFNAALTKTKMQGEIV